MDLVERTIAEAADDAVQEGPPGESKDESETCPEDSLQRATEAFSDDVLNEVTQSSDQVWHLPCQPYWMLVRADVVFRSS